MASLRASYPFGGVARSHYNITQPKYDVLLYLLVSTRAVIGQLEKTRYGPRTRLVRGM